ncbi:MAG: RidA family protein [Proteobacteria bacterium]|nr:RidA family protein [Pseudomonadota bacterium]
MHRKFSPATLAPPGSGNHHGVEVAPGARWLMMSGQVARRRDGTIAEGIEAQIEQCWQNVRAILAEGGMGLEDVVKITTYLTHREDGPAYRAAMKRHLGELRPPSTMVLVAGLALPEMRVEIDVVAARA